jgi:TP901-1 family phage major tail protein
MAAEKGSAFLLKIGDGGSPVIFSTLAGLKTTNFAINAETVNITHKGSGGWRELLGGAGIRSVSVSGSGVFTNSVAEQRLRIKAISGDLDEYQMSFESGETIRAKFQVSRLDYNGERTYSVTLESSGSLTIL